MRIADRNWMDLETYLQRDDRAMLPLGSTEQHAYLSLATDSLLAEQVAIEAAEPLGVPVFPVVSYGITPRFMAYPGTLSLRLETYAALLRDLLESLARQGFRRLLIVNGHGGNTGAKVVCSELQQAHPEVRIQWHDWWNAPRTWAKVLAIDPLASHASWMENFPWTRTVATPPTEPKPMADLARAAQLPPEAFRRFMGDGSFGGAYQRADADMAALWEEAVAETRALLEGGWA